MLSIGHSWAKTLGPEKDLPPADAANKHGVCCLRFGGVDLSEGE